jgi:hypothetical protein
MLFRLIIVVRRSSVTPRTSSLCVGAPPWIDLCKPMSSDKQQPLADRSFFIAPAMLAVTALALVSYFKGWNNGIQAWGQPYWVINYSDGFIRRAFLGALFSLFYDSSDVNRLWSAVLTFHTATCMLTLFALLLWLRGCLRENNVLVLLSIAAVFATSQFLPTLAYNTGYLDAPLYLLMVIAAASVAGGVYWPAVLIGMVGPLVHDSFIFLWATLAFLMLYDRRPGRTGWKAAVLAGAVLSTAAVYFLPSRAAAMAQFSAAPLPNDVRSWMVEVTSAWTMSDALTDMAERYSKHSINFLLSLLFFGLPTSVMIGTYAVFRALRRSDFGLLFLAACAPAAILVLGWDLSRFLVATALSGFLSILFMETGSGQEDRQRILRPRWLWPAWGAAALFLLLPLAYVYFGHGKVIDAGILPLSRTPLGEHLQWFIEGPYSTR